MIEKIAEQLVSLFVSDVSNYFREQKQYASRVAAITDAINKMLDHEKGNSYFNSVDRVLSNSMLLRNLAYEVKSFRDAEIDERIEAAVARDESIPAADIKRVCEVIKRILIQAHDIITQPTSLQDKLHVAWINDAKNEIKDDVSNAKKELQQQLKQMTDTLQKEVLLTDEQYEAFEHMVVELYLAGHLLAIQEIVLASENWQAYEIPQQLLSLTCFMKIAYQYYDSGLVSSKEVAVYLSLPGTPIIDELFLCLLFLCGNKEEKEMLLAQSEHERWKEYYRLFQIHTKTLQLPFKDLWIEDSSSAVIAASILVRNYENAQLDAYRNELIRAKQVLPMPCFERYMLLMENSAYARTYIGCAYTHSMLEECRLRADRYYSFCNFYACAAADIKKRFYRGFCILAASCSADYFASYMTEINQSICDDTFMIPYLIEYWLNSNTQPEQMQIDTLLKTALVYSERERHLDLLQCSVALISKSFVYEYLEDHRFLLKEDSRYLKLAIETEVITPKELPKYSSCYEEDIIYCCLCDTLLTAELVEGQEFRKQALQSYMKHPMYPLSYMRKLWEYAFEFDCLTEFESKLPEMMPIIFWRIRAQFYNDIVGDVKTALESIRFVTATSVAVGNDYVLHGRLTTSAKEAYEIYEKGYQRTANLHCLFELLSMQLRHAKLDEQLLREAERIDERFIQLIVAQCYKQLNREDKHFAHLVRAALLCQDYQMNIYGQLAFSIMLDNHSDELQTVNDHSYVKLKDADGNVLTVCFYPNADMLPTVESSFAEAKHILADQRNLLYTRLRGRGIGHELVYDGTQYRVVEMGITYGHLCRYCLAELAQHRDVLQLSGTVEKLLDNVTSIVSESVSMGDMLRTEYLKPDNNYIGYRCFANKANESLIAAIDMLVRCSMPLRSVASHDLIQEAEYIIGLDTLYLLAILPLEESERCKLLKRMIMSESTYACYQAEMKEDFDMQLRSGGQFQMIDGKLVIVENNLDDPCAYARTLYDPIIPLAEHIRKESAIFDYPDMCKDTYGRLAEVYGQHVLDNFQLISDSRHVVLNDRSEAYIYQCLNLSQPMCTIMNVLASDDISLGSKVKSFSKLAEIRYVGCISFVFFFSLNQHMKVLQQANEPDIYEAYLSEIISALNTIANNSDAYLGDMYQVIKCFSDMSLLSDAVPSILVEFMLHHIPDSTLESDQLPVDGESK